MGDLSKELTNRTEQSFEIPVNRMNISCEDCSGDDQRASVNCVTDVARKAIGALFPREQRADLGTTG
jgi:hypothetical protein